MYKKYNFLYEIMQPVISILFFVQQVAIINCYNIQKFQFLPLPNLKEK